MKIFNFTRLLIILLCSFFYLGGVVGCADFVAEQLLGGETITELGDGKYQVSYDGVGAQRHWAEACMKVCGSGKFDIISSNQVNRPRGISGWTGIIQCK